MKEKFHQRRPIMASVLWALLILVFYTLGGAITTITGVTESKYLLINGLFVFASAIAALIYMLKSQSKLSAYGFEMTAKNSMKNVYFFIPAIFYRSNGIFCRLT